MQTKSLGKRKSKTLADEDYEYPKGPKIGDGPNTVSESTVSNTELSEFLALAEFRGESSVSSSRPIICVKKGTHQV